MDSIYMMLKWILNQKDEDGIFRYNGMTYLPAEYLSEHDLDGKPSEQEHPIEFQVDKYLEGKQPIPEVPVKITAVANEKGITIQYTADFGKMIFDEIKDMIYENYIEIVDNLLMRETEATDNHVLAIADNYDYHKIIAKDEKYQEFITKKLNEKIGKDLKHYEEDLGIPRENLVSAVRNGINRNDIIPTPCVNYTSKRTYSPDDDGFVKIPVDNTAILKIISTMFKDKKIIKERTVSGSVDAFLSQ
ncbi:MAG: hypothetical protein KAI18_00550, partial [Candidatus Aenigmarchaeota archaeon]|nr:hypothetical protein [Candidatus Aenigmarchaeota archaeon]